MNQGRYYEYGCHSSFRFNMQKIFLYMWKNKLKAQSFSSSRIQKNKQWNEYCGNFRISEMPKGSMFRCVQYNRFPLQTLALSHFGYYYLNHTTHFFWASFFRVSVQYRSPVPAKEAQMGGYSCSSSDRLQKPAGTLPPAPSIHLVCWCNSTLLRALLSVSQDFGQNITIPMGLINGMRNGNPRLYTHIHTQITCCSWNDWQF